MRENISGSVSLSGQGGMERGQGAESRPRPGARANSQVRCEGTIIAHKSLQTLIFDLDLSEHPTSKGCF